MTNFRIVLKSIIEGEIQNVSTEILNEMIKNIGSTDPLLRDQLIYCAFCKLLNGEHLDKQQLEYILTELLNKQLLTLKIEKPMTDSVFTRSFTALFYAAILEIDATKQIIDVSIVRRVIDSAHDYMMKEQDLRGYVEHKGWAHASAHGADLLDSLIKHPVSTEEDAEKVLKNITRFITIAEGYQDDEEERLARAFVALSKYHLTEGVIMDWIKELEHSLRERRPKHNGDLDPYYAQLAFKNFLKAAYFLLEKEVIHKDLQRAIKKIVVGLIY